MKIIVNGKPDQRATDEWIRQASLVQQNAEKEKRRLWRKKYNDRTRDQRIKNHKAWREENKDQWNAYYRKYYREHREIIANQVQIRRAEKKIKRLRMTPLAAKNQGVITELIYNKILMRARKRIPNAQLQRQK